LLSTAKLAYLEELTRNLNQIMNSKYTILGTTGNVGRSLLAVLSESPDNTVHAFVRSKIKLERLCPKISSNSNIKIFEGDLDNIEVLSQCLKGTRAAFLAVAVTDNVPGCSIAQDTARNVIAALRLLQKQHPTARLPHLVVLSSASTEGKLWRDQPQFLHGMMWRAFSNVYTDLTLAENYLRQQGDWVSSTFVKPGGLVHDAQKGHELSTERQQTFLSFLDLAGGMVEIADAGEGVWEGKSVSVVPTAKDVKIEWMALWYVLKGLLCHFLPSTYGFLSRF
jgi:putative NADH-flavin reductase